MLSTHLFMSLVLVLPPLLMALAGFLLWNRHRSLATLLIASGFTALFVALGTGLIGMEYSVAYIAGQPPEPSLIARYLGSAQVITGLLGLWAGSTGVLLHAVRDH